MMPPCFWVDRLAAVQAKRTIRVSSSSVKSEGKGALHFTPAIYWNHGEDRFELFRNAPEKYPFNFHKTNVAGANLNFRVDSRLGQTAFGAEARHERIISTNLGEKRTDPRGVYVCGLNR